jgi:cell division protease FtsH
MADALIKYETIDRDQIDDVMAGRPPRPPADWTDQDRGVKATASESAVVKGKKPDTDTTIGGPAGEH